MFPLRDGVAVVTGAGSGIGAALAEALAARGCNLALADINDAGLAAVAAGARAHGVNVSEHRIDMADRDAVAALPEAVIGEHGRVTVLVNNAGVALLGRFDELTLAEFEWLMDINFWGVVRATHAFLPHLKREAQAHIVNISSIFGVIAPYGQSAYCASKFGVRGFSEALRHELAGSPVSLTVVHPGGVKTKIAKNARVAQSAVQGDPAEAAARIDRLLRLSPDIAAAQIVRAIETRAPRLLIGKDAKQMELIQRLFPVGYWARLAKAMGR